MAKSGTKFILAGITGVAVGFALGILFAPDKGSKTRKKVRKKIRHMAESLGEDYPENLGFLKSMFNRNPEEETSGNEEPNQ
ncbi:MAG TPA: YtxH domain-containing protein [Bacteroidales bacterium]|nr:YtxH domain-containing protein [Bacteroidales bacterium]